MGYCTKLYIFKGGSVMPAQYWDEYLDPIERLNAAAAGSDFFLMVDNVHLY